MIGAGQTIEVVHALAKAGAAVVVQLPGAYGGGALIQLTPAEAEQYLADTHGFVARKMGVTVADLDAWQEHEHIPKCAGYTKAGARCAKAISPHTMFEAADFAAAHRVEYCHVHR